MRIYSQGMLDATRLRVLTAVAREGSVTAAARVLNYSQPSISHHIARLEAETGVKLMERAGRGIRLTEAGRLLADRAQEILSRIDAAETELAAHAGLRQRQARLAAFPSALATIVPGALAMLRGARSGADVCLREAEPAIALQMLREGQVDIALTCRYAGRGDSREEESGDGLHTQLILEEPVCLITGPVNGHPMGDATAGTTTGHPPADATAPDLGCYARARWITACDHNREFLFRECAAAGFTPTVALSASDFAAIQALVAAGFGVALVPELALRLADYPDLTAHPLPGARRQIMVVTNGEPPPKSAIRRLTTALAAEARRGRFHDLGLLSVDMTD